jgi:phosphate transport system substrate-binding protein
MKKLILTILDVSGLLAVILAISNAKRHIAAIGSVVLLAAQTNAQTITGAGSTFDYPAFTKWFEAYGKIDPNVQFNYQSIGSGAGKKQLQNQTVDFGASDAPMSDDELSKSPGKILHIPIVVGGEAIVYNLPGSPKLKLDADTFSGIYLGNIAKWNDPKIAMLNPGVDLPDLQIVVVHRSDGSGTTFIFTDYLSSISPIWADSVGKGTAVKWPAAVGIGAKGNEGVAGQVKQTAGAIGYVELAYARQNQMTYADLKNAAGNFVLPDLDTVSAAMATAKIPDDFRFSIVNAPGANAYPISGASWVLTYQHPKNVKKSKKLVSFLKWAVTDGQKVSSALDYAPLPDEVRQRELKMLDTIK